MSATIKDQQAQEYAEKMMENVYSQEWDSEYVEGLIERAFEDGYTACEQSDLRISVAKLREVLEKLVADGDIEPIHVSVDEIINRVKKEK